VKNLLVVPESSQVIVLSEQEVSAIPVERCHLANKSCGDCVALQDPYCAWDIKTNTCSPFRLGQSAQLQNVNIGFHAQCPVPIIIEAIKTTPAMTTEKVTTMTKKIVTPLEEMTTFQTSLQDDTTFETTISDECPSCNCECRTSSHDHQDPTSVATSTLKTTTTKKSNNESTRVDLLDIYDSSTIPQRDQSAFEDSN
jgi:hypothetical protein